MNTKSIETVLGDGSYESPINTDLFFLDENGKYRIVRSGSVFNWLGPDIIKPTKNNVILVGSGDGTTNWIDLLDLLPKDYGVVGNE